MQRKAKEEKTVHAILTADWHLREDVPECRNDNFWNAQWRKVDYVSRLQEKYNCPVLHAGDLFDHWKPSPMLLTKAIQCIPKQFFTVYGNHDLPQHNLELSYKCGTNTLVQAKAIELLINGHFGQEEPEYTYFIGCRNICVWHTFTYIGKKPWPDCTSPTAVKIATKYKSKDIDLILTGDNHQSFTVKDENLLLVNPGSLMRQTADQIDHEPSVYLYHAEDNSVTRIKLPIDVEAVSREHLDKKEEHDSRLEAFMSKLNGDWEAGISFEENLKQFIDSNPKLNKKVVEIIYQNL